MLSQAMQGIRPVVNHEINPSNDRAVFIHDYRLDNENPSLAFAVEMPKGENTLRMVASIRTRDGQPVPNTLRATIFERTPSGDRQREGHLTKDQFDTAKTNVLHVINAEIRDGNAHPHLPKLRDLIRDYMNFPPRKLKEETRKRLE